MATMAELFDASAKKRDSLLCVGLDPRATSAAGARDECLWLIDATADAACAFKPNSAFFEVYGADGMAALRDVIAHVPKGTPLLLDAKRGDFADTAEFYARAAFETLGATALTVHPYLGTDAIAPFLARAEHGAFVLCKTSNPDGEEFQSLAVVNTSGQAARQFFANLTVDSTFDVEMLYERIARRAQEWNTKGNVGLVVGATYPEALKRVRVLAPELWILVPGVGAQGGDLDAAVHNGLRADGMGILISASRSIARAAEPRAEAMRLRDAINAARR